MTDYPALTNLPAMFFEQARQKTDNPFLWARRDGAYHAMTWRQVDTAVRDLARGLRSLGLQRGERVVILAENRPEWLIADVAIMAAGGVTVPAHTPKPPGAHTHIRPDGGARGVIVSTRTLAKALLPAAMNAADCRWVIGMEDLKQDQRGPVELHQWEDVLDAGAAMPDDVDQAVARIARTDTACFIYKS